MKKYKIVLLSGDGIGPEISEVSKKVLKSFQKIIISILRLLKNYLEG